MLISTDWKYFETFFKNGFLAFFQTLKIFQLLLEFLIEKRTVDSYSKRKNT
jgi:hypothetical protein